MVVYRTATFTASIIEVVPDKALSTRSCVNSLVVLGLSYLCVTLLDSIVHSGQSYCCGHVIPELSV